MFTKILLRYSLLFYPFVMFENQVEIKLNFFLVFQIISLVY
jgi:hypothetical protein